MLTKLELIARALLRAEIPVAVPPLFLLALIEVVRCAADDVTFGRSEEGDKRMRRALEVVNGR